MNEKQGERWQKTLAKGKSRYLIRGVLSYLTYSILGAAAWRLCRVFISGKPYEFLYENVDNVTAAAVGMAIFGYLQAKWEWKKSEKEYVLSHDEGRADINKGITIRA